jgi:hypothetical protein
MSEALLGLNWSQPSNPHIRVNVVLMHGSADQFTEVALTFPDSPKSRQNARLAIDALPHLSDAICKNRETTLEDACAYAAKKLGADAELLAKMFDTVILCDSACDDFCAHLVAFTVEHHTASGGVRRASFPCGRGKARRYKLLRDIHHSNLKPWA